MKILLAVDDSKFSSDALRAVATQFRPQDTEVRVIHVLQPISFVAPPEMAADYTPELQEEGKKARELVERAAKDLRAAGFKAEGTVEKGDVRETIVDTAASWHADLIVLGSRGRSGLRRLLLGSVAEFVVRHAPCTVQVVRAAPAKTS